MSTLLATSYSICVATIDLIGLFGNVSLLLIILLNKAFRQNKCSIIIGFIAFCDGSIEFLTIILQIFHLSGHQFYQHECFYTMIVIVFTNCCQTVIPIFRSAVGCGYSILVSKRYLFLEADRPLIACNPPASLNTIAHNIWNKTGICLNVITVLVYGTAGVILWLKARNQPSAHIRTEITVMKTIAFIVLFYICTWCLMNCLNFLKEVSLKYLTADEAMTFVLASGIPAHSCFAGNFYIYMWRNLSYREAFIRLWKRRSTHVVSTFYSN
ncbi:hypothetical protein L596_013078 [Steinernema carpocapsae]|uniref:G-protein coupled receptors family 1 profile domain-containing protein n=1 Tax=Steinernema carpocapsae TaxID=34508 RepID=A0A4U5NZ56_STECR|nr:hypothetical protein L596_013078 [Steinernema carpocapsae]